MRQLVDAWNEGGVAAAAEYWTDDVVFHDAPEFPDAGVHRGKEAIAERARSMWEAWGDWRYRLLDFSSDGDWTAAVVRSEGRGPRGVSYDEEWVHVYRWSGHAVAEMRIYSGRAQAREAGWPV